MNSKDWSRVVAVFVLGATWQFKNWYWTTPVDIFSRVLGFYLHYEEEIVPELIKAWDVKILSISKQQSKKHLVQTAALEYWKAIDLFCASKKPNLSY